MLVVVLDSSPVVAARDDPPPGSARFVHLRSGAELADRLVECTHDELARPDGRCVVVADPTRARVLRSAVAFTKNTLRSLRVTGLVLNTSPLGVAVAAASLGDLESAGMLPPDSHAMALRQLCERSTSILAARSVVVVPDPRPTPAQRLRGRLGGGMFVAVDPGGDSAVWELVRSGAVPTSRRLVSLPSVAVTATVAQGSALTRRRSVARRSRARGSGHGPARRDLVPALGQPAGHRDRRPVGGPRRDRRRAEVGVRRLLALLVVRCAVVRPGVVRGVRRRVPRRSGSRRCGADDRAMNPVAATVLGTAAAAGAAVAATPAVLSFAPTTAPGQVVLRPSPRARWRWAVGLPLCSALATAVTAWRVPGTLRPAAVFLMLAMVLAAAVDARVGRLPNVVVLPSTVAVVALLGLAEYQEPASGSLRRSLVAYAVVLVTITVAALVRLPPNGVAPVGMGDSRFLALPVPVLAYRSLEPVLHLGLGCALLIVVVGSWWWSARGPRGPMPLGPLICLSALVALWTPIQALPPVVG